MKNIHIIPTDKPSRLETLEEAAENHSNQTIRDDSEKSFIEGAKWQAERMYSEEEVRKIAWDGRLFFHENKDTPFSNMRTSFIKWFEQHKKK